MNDATTAGTPPHTTDLNVAVVRGRVATEPTTRTLPAGGAVTQFDVATGARGRAASVPVALAAADVEATLGDEVVVTGRIVRRFFRAGGVTQSRSELVADAVIRVRRRRAVERALAAAAAALTAPSPGA